MDQEVKESLGIYLKRAREAAGIDTSSLARENRISESILEAIETDDWSALPGDTYARAYLRSIAKRLDLDQDKILKWYLKDTSQGLKNHDENLIKITNEDGSELRERSGKPKAAFLVFIVIILIILFRAYQQNQDDEPQKTTTSNSSAIETSSQDNSMSATADSLSNSKASSANQKSSSSEEKLPKLTSFTISTDTDSTWIHFKAKGYKDWARFIRKGRKPFSLTRQDTIEIELEASKTIKLLINGKKVKSLAPKFKVYDGKVLP